MSDVEVAVSMLILSYKAFAFVIMPCNILQYAFLARIRIAVHAEKATRVIHADILTNHATTGLTPAFVLI